MNYLAHSTLKAFLYLLYGKNFLLLLNFKDTDRKKIIADIFSNNLSDLFLFKNSETTFHNPSLEGINANLFDISPNIKTLSIKLPRSNNIKLTDFIYKYVKEYKKKGILKPSNFCSFEVSYKESIGLLSSAERQGGKIDIEIPVNEKSRTVFYKSDVRFLDILFYLLGEEYIDISVGEIKKISHEVAEDLYKDELLFPLAITFKKPLKEISDIEDIWLRYETLSLNTKTALAKFEGKEGPFQSIDDANFRLLKFLIKNHDIYNSITDIYSYLYPKDKGTSEEAIKSKKKRIEAIVKNIRGKLEMNKNSSPHISIKSKYIILEK